MKPLLTPSGVPSRPSQGVLRHELHYDIYTQQMKKHNCKLPWPPDTFVIKHAAIHIDCRAVSDTDINTTEDKTDCIHKLVACMRMGV
mmetsp:Transcript_17992/g.29629  ORF Transcript_17992/g.29629 Transcript_17992/m.29629 type:complete len:87 (+) Transcript_17992:497-757(+)